MILTNMLLCTGGVSDWSEDPSFEDLAKTRKEKDARQVFRGENWMRYIRKSQEVAELYQGLCTQAFLRSYAHMNLLTLRSVACARES